MSLPDLPLLTQRARQTCPKPPPHVVTKVAKAKTKAQQAKAFREAVWMRDEGRSRASGTPLRSSGTVDWTRLGEVHHGRKRSTHPADRFDPSNGILLSKQEHAFATVACPSDPRYALLEIKGPADLAKPHTFIWRDVNGREIRRRQE